MSETNFNYIHFISILIIIISFSTIYSFPFYNLQSTELSNGNKLIVHKYGIDICNKDFNEIIGNEITFSNDEQISTSDKMVNIILEKFDDGYVICLIYSKAYIFDNLGHFLSDRGNLNFGYTSNYYSLNIKDNYHFFVGSVSNEYFYLYYYEYDKFTKKINYLSGFENYRINKPLSFSYYSFNEGLNCHIMQEEGKTETLACFFMLRDGNKYYWYVKFFNLNDETIIEDGSYSPIKKESSSQYLYFKVDVNSEKNIALICGYLGVGADACFYFDISKKNFDEHIYYLNDIFSSEVCIKYNYGLKVNYFSEKNQFIFSCISGNNYITYILFYFDDNNSLKNDNHKLNSTNECEYFNGYNFFYSQEEDNYYIISDYLCNKSNAIEESQITYEKEEEISSQEKETESTGNTEKTEEYECQQEKCLKCDESSESENLCITCNIIKGYFPLKSSSFGNINPNYIDCFNENTKPENFFLNISEKYYEPCYETCAKCDKGGNELNNNCLQCEYGFKFLPGLDNTFNCYVKCPFLFYFAINGQYKCTKSSICPEEYYLLIKEKEQCIEDCSKDDEYKFQYDGECYKKCPNNSNDNNDFICLDNNIEKCSLSEKEILFVNDMITEEEMENLAKAYVKEFSYTDNHISLFTNKDIQITLYKKYECVTDLDLETPSVNLANCYEKIQGKYAIEDNLIFGIISQRIKENNKIISFSIYSPYNGHYLNITGVCDEERIEVQEDISNKIENKEQYNLVKYLSQQNVDVFNLSSDFYTDICFYYDSPIKKDISLKDRIKIFFPNITLCENGCSIKGINATSMRAECDCKMNNLLNNNALTNNAFYKSQIGDIEELLSQINIEVVKCSTNMFKYKSFFSFVGPFIIFSLIILEIILTIIYCIISVNPLKRYVHSITDLYLNLIQKNENSPPKKDHKDKHVKIVNTEISPKKDHKSKKRNKTENTKSPEKEKRNKHEQIINNTEILQNKSNKSSKRNKTENIKSPNKNKKKKGKKNRKSNLINSSIISKKVNINNNSKDIIIFSPLNNKKIITEEKNKVENILISKNEFDIKMDEYLETDFEDLIFEEVTERDHRSFCEYFTEQIKSNLLIINIILTKEPFKPRTIKLLLFIINIDLYLIINALFINEEFISDIFHSDNDNFFNFLPRCIDRIFYTTLVKVIVNYIVDCFFIEEKKIKIIVKNKNNKIEDIKTKINEIMIKALRRYLYFIIFTFVVSLFSLFYITCFNYRYYYSANEWIKSSIFIIVFIEILSILTILLETCLRMISFKINSEKIYKLSLFFS